MNAKLEHFQGIQQKQVEFFHLHMGEGLDEVAELYKLLTIANETFLDGLKETLQIATNPNYSESKAQWPALIDHNMRRAVKLNQAYAETSKAIQARVVKSLAQEMPAYSQQFLDSVEQLTQVLGRVAETAETKGNDAVRRSATPPQPSQQKSRKTG